MHILCFFAFVTWVTTCSGAGVGGVRPRRCILIPLISRAFRVFISWRLLRCARPSDDFILDYSSLYGKMLSANLRKYVRFPTHRIHMFHSDYGRTNSNA